jgi:pilus assembly protein FimV
MESPTIEIGAVAEAEADDDAGDDPTIEQRAADDPEASDGMTIESPTIEMPAAEEGDTVEQPDLSATGNPADLTAELALDDLGLDVGDIDDLPAADELSATGVTRALDEGDFDIESTGTAVLDYDDDSDEDASYTTRTEVLEQSAGQFEVEEPVGDDDLDLNLDELSSALGGGDTVEQPGPGEFEAVDLDIGDDILADDEPTGTEELGLDPDQMTEVGTKLDLARAYIDMGDPEGARSILDEVLTEGDAGQRREAQSLLDALPAA